MSILSDTMRMGASQPSADTAYQIEKSLRINPEDDPRLKRTPSTDGNRRVFTFAAWIKKSKTCHEFFAAPGSSDAYFVIGFDSSDRMHIAVGDGSDNNVTNRVFRDSSAWFHVVVAVDTTQSTQNERLKIHINGKRETSFNASPDFISNVEFGVNQSSVIHYIGGDSGSSSDHDGYLADVQLIDGLQLSPAAFGEFSSAGVWNPKTFALPVINTGVTWSSNLTSSTGSFYSAGYPKENIFNGVLTKGTDPSTNTGTITFTPSSSISYGTEVQLHSSHTEFQASTAVITHDDDTTTTTILTGNKNPIIATGKGTIKSLAVTCNSGWLNWSGISVDHKLLLDGKTDPETRSNPNNNIDWTSKLTGTLNNSTKDNIFDGSASTIHELTSAGNYTFTHTFTGVKTLRVYGYAGSGAGAGAMDIAVNGSGAFAPTTAQRNTNCWVNLDVPANGIVTSIKWTRHSTGGGEEFDARMVEVNGHVLIDNTVDNSFHLKFNDTSSNARLGRNSFNTTVEDATGGLPIYNTDSVDGSSKVSGYRSDSSAGTSSGSGLILAIPGDSLASGTCDVHQQINTGSSNKSVSTAGSIAVTTDQSRLYGSSIDFDGSDDVITFAESSDWLFEEGDFTIEFWAYFDSISTNGAIISNMTNFNDSGEYNARWVIGLYSSELRIWTADNGDHILHDFNPSNNVWTHYAFTRETGNSFTLYKNGINIHQVTQTADFDGNAALRIGHLSNLGYFNGKLQDLRIYKGTAKYTANFAPPSKNDFTVTNLTEAATDTTITAASGNVTYKQWDSAWNESSNIWDTTPDSSGTTNSASWDGQNGTIILDLGAANARITLDQITGSGGSVLTGNDPTLAKAYWTNQDLNISSFNSANMPNYVCPHRYMMIYAGVGGGTSTFTASGDAGTSFVDRQTQNIDVLNDTPTNYGSGSSVRGNFCTWNALDKGNGTLSQGNLLYVGDNSWERTLGTFGVSTGKWYYELQLLDDPYDQNDTSHYWIAGFTSNPNPTTNQHSTDWLGLEDTGWYRNFGSRVNGSTAMITGGIASFSVDLDNNTFNIRYNNSSIVSGTIGGTAGRMLWPFHMSYHPSNYRATANFGQRSFVYDPPANHEALCTQNLDDFSSGDSVNDPRYFFDVTTYTGTGSSRDFKYKFGPDLIWLLNRGGSGTHRVNDQILGTNNYLKLEQTSASTSEANNITAFNSDGYTMGTNGDINSSGGSYVSYNWDAGTAASGANNDGTVNVSSGNQWVNTTAGFSITKVDTDAANTNFGHGLNAKPEFIISKKIGATSHWHVYHDSIHSGGGYLNLESSGIGSSSSTGAWSQAPDNTKIYTYDNITDGDWIFYAWTPIPGFSAFGKYTGGSSDPNQAFVFTGFRPRFVMTKGTTLTDGSSGWNMYDSERHPGNPIDIGLNANSNNAEFSGTARIDFLSNGFKIRSPDSGYEPNQNETYAYMCWAESPFKTARAR